MSQNVDTIKGQGEAGGGWRGAVRNGKRHLLSEIQHFISLQTSNQIDLSRSNLVCIDLRPT